MILVCSEKSFLKRRKKWVLPKDFLIEDAIDDASSKVYEFGNRVWAHEFAPTPTLAKIAADPDSEDAKIKRRQINRYIDIWLSDEVIGMKLGFTLDVICQNVYRTGEDLNVFIIMKNKHYKCYGSLLVDFMNDMFDMQVAELIDRNMPKETQKRMLERPVDPNFIDKLSRRVKKYMKQFSESQLQDMYASCTV